MQEICTKSANMLKHAFSICVGVTVYTVSLSIHQNVNLKLDTLGKGLVKNTMLKDMATSQLTTLTEIK